MHSVENYGNFCNFHTAKNATICLSLLFCVKPSFVNLEHTVWKLQDCCITQISREINFESVKSEKTAVFAILGALNLVSFGKFHPSKSAKFHEYQNADPLNVIKWLILPF